MSSIPSELTPKQKEFLDLSRHDNTSQGWLCLHIAFTHTSKESLAQFADWPDQGSANPHQLTAFKTSLRAHDWLSDDRFRWMNSKNTLPRPFVGVLYDAGMHHLKTCLATALPSHRKALSDGKAIEIEQLIQEAVEQNPAIDPIVSARHIFHLSGLMFDGMGRGRRVIRYLINFDKLLANPFDPYSTIDHFSHRNRLFIALACLFRHDKRGYKTEFSLMQTLWGKCFHNNTLPMIEELQKKCADGALKQEDFDQSPLFNGLFEIYISCRDETFSSILKKLHLFISEARQEAPPKENQEAIVYPFIWESCRHLIYAFNPIITSLPIYKRAVKLIQEHRTEHPLAKEKDIIHMLKQTLFPPSSEQRLSSGFCSMLYQTWWFRTFPDDSYSLTERLCEWYAQEMLNDPEMKISKEQFVTMMDKWIRKNRYPLPLDLNGARRAYDKMQAAFNSEKA